MEQNWEEARELGIDGGLRRGPSAPRPPPIILPLLALHYACGGPQLSVTVWQDGIHFLQLPGNSSVRLRARVLEEASQEQGHLDPSPWPCPVGDAPWIPRLWWRSSLSEEHVWGYRKQCVRGPRLCPYQFSHPPKKEAEENFEFTRKLRMDELLLLPLLLLLLLLAWRTS